MSKEELLKKIKGGLIVSCQAQENEPLHSDFIMSRMALAAKVGGAVAIRANGVKDIKAIKEVVDLPIIGLIKRDYPNTERYITPTLKEIKELVEVGVDIVAMDATDRDQNDGVSLEEKVKFLHDNGVLAMADISTLEEGIIAQVKGFDIISTTLSGYTSYSPQIKEPDFKLVEDLTKSVSLPIVAEGRITELNDLKKILKFNPFSVVIGGAITRPQQITARYVEIINSCK
ncbi:N-acetylmannosamine-6-phosphate 2-epimerase [Haploplasma axanthum]|uniref:Putative N-acetylmannosamine-6-phosphate 2-epimerase n=1 Tax=Haploplasma axanthum TaxID=29552 RepID=A0A449BBG3_HAPAX|nr:N-acetylmannosamine-6-phosphate 2-epimerase [Haploplasma axanthum]VEU79755.1 N-acetylmannosamine-6-phosphate 2-epimerase [Haploplasma axanthum]